MVTSIVSSWCWSHSSRTQCFAFYLKMLCFKFQSRLSERNLFLRSYRGLKRLKNKHKPAASNYALSFDCKFQLKGSASFFSHNFAGAWVLSPPAPPGLQKELFGENIFVRNPSENELFMWHLPVPCVHRQCASQRRSHARCTTFGRVQRGSQFDVEMAMAGRLRHPRKRQILLRWNINRQTARLIRFVKSLERCLPLTFRSRSCTLFPPKKFGSQNRIRLVLRLARAIGFGRKWNRRVDVRCERDFRPSRLESWWNVVRRWHCHCQVEGTCKVQRQRYLAAVQIGPRIHSRRICGKNIAGWCWPLVIKLLFQIGWGYAETSRLDTGRDHVAHARELPIRAVRNEDCFLEFPAIARISSRRTFCGGWPGFKANVCVGDSGELSSKFF